MAKRVPRQNGDILSGDSAVAVFDEPEITDGFGNITRQATPSGINYILSALNEAYGQEEQDLQGVALDRCFALLRGNAPLMDYLTAFKTRYETAER